MLLITDISGHVGLSVARNSLAAGIKVRGVTLEFDSVRSLAESGAEIVEVSDPQPLEATGTEDNVVPLRVASHKKG